MPLISLVVPCYNEEESIPLFQEEAARVLDEMQTRFGSPQDPVTFELVASHARIPPRASFVAS